jgi:hypothetical protein
MKNNQGTQKRLDNTVEIRDEQTFDEKREGKAVDPRQESKTVTAVHQQLQNELHKHVTRSILPIIHS